MLDGRSCRGVTQALDDGLKRRDEPVLRNVRGERLVLLGVRGGALQAVEKAAGHVVRRVGSFQPAQDGPLHDVGVFPHYGHAPVRAEALAAQEDVVVAQRLAHRVHVRCGLQHVQAVQRQPALAPELLAGTRCVLSASFHVLGREQTVGRHRRRSLAARVGPGQPDAALAHDDHVGNLAERRNELRVEIRLVQFVGRQPLESRPAKQSKDGRTLRPGLGRRWEAVHLDADRRALRIGPVHRHEEVSPLDLAEAPLFQSEALGCEVERARFRPLGGQCLGRFRGEGGTRCLVRLLSSPVRDEENDSEDQKRKELSHGNLDCGRKKESLPHPIRRPKSRITLHASRNTAHRFSNHALARRRSTLPPVTSTPTR